MTYKECPKVSIGDSDVAVLVMVGYDTQNGIKSELLHFGGDGCYYAYIVHDREITIPEHYQKVATFNKWLKIYDDSMLMEKLEGENIEVYRAGNYGCIIRIY